MEFLYEYGLFLAKAVTIVVVIGALVAIIATTAGRHRTDKGELQVTDLSEELKHLKDHLKRELLNKKAFKAYDKARKAEEKAIEKADAPKAKTFVLDFKGSIDAHEVASLREEISAILTIAEPGDEVLLTVESGGGMVHGYGLAASQLDRLRQADIPLTVCIDKVAASGGYLMACVANRIYAAPFAIVGSIGVVAQLPNFNRLLKKHDIDFEQHTAGQFKRTLTVFGENTEEGRQKFREELEETHLLFKAFVTKYRPDLDLAKVATGEHWYGEQSLGLGLVDGIRTSDDLLLEVVNERSLIKVRYQQKKKLSDKIAHSVSLVAGALMGKLSDKSTWTV